MDTDGSMEAAADAFSKLGVADDTPLTEDDEREDDAGELSLADDELQPENDDAPDGDEPEGDDGDPEDEPQAAIDPPASWDAAAKAVFAKLPPEAQQIVADRESARDKLLSQKANEASQAQRNAQREASAQVSELQRHYAEQLDTYAKAFEPQRPDWQLATQDPAAFAQQMAIFEAATAQRNDLAQRAEQARQQAEAIEQQNAQESIQADAARLVESIPEWADTGKRQELIGSWVGTARALGYGDDLINQARADDFIAMHRVSQIKAKADKWDALQAGKMEAVRAAKGKPKVAVPGAAQPRGAGDAQRRGDAMNRLAKSGSLDDAAAAFRSTMR